MKLYKQDVKDEKNIQILDDDYAKFIRFAHWKIQQSGVGSIGFITKNTYLSTGAFKGMRKQLLKTFDKIYVFNLHGKLYEKVPNGKSNDSVFNIRVGTAILFLIKNNVKTGEYAKLFYQDLYGTRNEKFEFLSNNILDTMSWEELEIDTKHYFFEKKIFDNQALYEEFISLTDIFQTKNSGVETGRDHFILADTKNELKNRLTEFIKSDLELELLRKSFNLLDQPNFKLSEVKSQFKKIDDNLFHTYSHKPFYNKVIYYDKELLRRHSAVIMDSFNNVENLGIVLSRRHAEPSYNHCFVTKFITDRNFLGGQSYIFPMYDIFVGKKVSNILPSIEKVLGKTYSRSTTPEEIFYYVYAVLFSNVYRQEFSELLKIDYPQIPFPQDYSLFKNTSELGFELINLHLLCSSKLNNPLTRLHGEGNSLVDKIKYLPDDGILKINSNQYFDNIPFVIWDYEVGKNKVVSSYLKRKEGKVLSVQEIIEFCGIVTSLKCTIDLQVVIDEIYTDIIANFIPKEVLLQSD